MTSPDIGYDEAAVAAVVAGLRQTATDLPAAFDGAADTVRAAAAAPLADGVERSPSMAAVAEAVAKAKATVAATSAGITDTATGLERWQRGEADINAAAGQNVEAQGGTP